MEKYNITLDGSELADVLQAVAEKCRDAHDALMREMERASGPERRLYRSAQLRAERTRWRDLAAKLGNLLGK